MRRRAGISITRRMLGRIPLPQADANADKNSRGSILIAGGSLETPGAVLLAGIAALRAGAGKLQLAVDRQVVTSLALAVPESLVTPLPKTGITRQLRDLASKADALLVGPGMNESRAARSLVRALTTRMKSDATLVLDAGALNAAGLRERCVITPHAGEMATLLDVDIDDVRREGPSVARTAAERFGCVVVLKGPTTFVATPDASLYHYTGGVVGLATSGSGDTLAGIIAGLAARGAEPLTAAAWGVWAHGRAGQALTRRLGRVGFLARELLDELSDIG